MPTKPILRLLLLLLSLGAMAVSAKTVNDAKSVIAVDLPDDWKFEESKIGGNPSTTATSDDGLLIVVMRIERKLPQEVMKRFADEMDALMPDAKFGDDADKITVH